METHPEPPRRASIPLQAQLPALLLALLLALTLAALAIGAYRPVLDLAMLGWDGWPLVAASRVGSVGELLGTFGEELMDGRYPHGRFYRPVTHLAFALDHALGGLDVRGYHRTDLAILVADGILLALLGGRLLGGGRGLGVGTLGAAIFLLHPVQLEVLPVPARRADTLCLLFLLGCLLSQPRPGRVPRAGRRVAAGVLAWLAAGAKETGALVVPVVFAWHLTVGSPCGDPVRALRGRLVPALRRTLPTLAGFAVYLVVRTAVLGGLGGHRPPVGATPVGATRIWVELGERVLHPQPLITGGSGELALITLVVLALVPLVWSGARRGDGGGSGPVLAFLALWTLGTAAITGLADRVHDWYAMLLAAPYALALALVAERGVAWARAGPRGVGAATAVAALALVVGHGAASFPLRAYPRLQHASELAQQNYDRLERMIEGSGEGQVVQLNPWFPMLAPNADGSDVRSLMLAAEYTIQAWCELHWPDIHFVVTRWDRHGRGLAPEPGVLKVQLVPGPEPVRTRQR